MSNRLGGKTERSQDPPRPTGAAGGAVLARNTVLNLGRHVIPALVGAISIPFVVQALGTPRFGILSLAYVLLTYFTLFDVGLGRATTKYVAEAIGRAEHSRIPELLWSAVLVQVALGVMAGGLLAAGAGPLARHVLQIPPELMWEAITTFRMLGLVIPVLLLTRSFGGVLEATQRFGVVNAVRIPINSLSFLAPLAGDAMSLGLPGIIGLILLLRLTALGLFVAFVFRVHPAAARVTLSGKTLRSLFAYGTWIGVTGLVGPILTYLDRFLLGAVVGVTAVAYYAAPYDGVVRLWLIPASMMLTVFPAFSALDGAGDDNRLGVLFRKVIKFQILALSPILVLLVVFTEEVLLLWLGADFVEASSLAVRVLAGGLLANAVAHVPLSLLQGIGRPDIPAKLHMAELPAYAVLAWFFVGTWGIAGAALAWSVRVVVDAILLFVAAARLRPAVLQGDGAGTATRASAALVLFTLAVAGAKFGFANDGFAWRAAVVFVGSSAYIATVWMYLLDPSDRRVIIKGVRLWRKLNDPA